jgi:hypothetical protein
MHVPARFRASLARNVVWSSTFTFNIDHREPHSIQRHNMLPDEIIAQLNAEFQCREQQIRHLAALYTVRTLPPQTSAHSDEHRRISHHHPSSTSTGSQQPANRQFCAPTSTYLAFPILSSTSASASPHDTSSSASSHHPSMRLTNTTMRRLIDDHMRVLRT